jgi:hypothetical protein
MPWSISGAALVLTLKVDKVPVARFTLSPDGTITASSQAAISRRAWRAHHPRRPCHADAARPRSASP